MGNIYKRVILKLSGEALAGKSGILDQRKLATVARIVKQIHDSGVGVGIVVGAGNIWRGRLAESIGIEQSTGDYMGMLGTIINALAIQSAVEKNGVVCKVQSTINVNQVCEPYIRRRAVHHLDKGEVVIFAGGTGNPYFTTDTTATLRALEVGAEAILMAKNGVDGVFDSDPRVNPDAKLLPTLSFREVIERKLGVMDLTAVAMLEGKNIKIHVFNMENEENFFRVLRGEQVGTIIQ
ncbi:MAG: UMP kinase [Erysipelotrichaceae bacterium]|nr:UMP kinase [Erysipelotrichaceae bacterium]